MESKNQGLSPRGRMSEETFSLFLDLATQKLGEERIASKISMGKSIVGWSLRLLDKQGPTRAHDVLVNGAYSNYTQEQLNSIAGLHFLYGISCEELEVSYVTSRHCIAKRVNRLKDTDLSKIDCLIEPPVFKVSYLKLIRAGVPMPIINQIENDLFMGEDEWVSQSILSMLYQLLMTEQKLKVCEELASAGNRVQLLQEFRECLQNLPDLTASIQSSINDQSSSSKKNSAILTQNSVHTVTYFNEDVSAFEMQKHEPVARKFGRAEKPIKFYPKKKIMRSKSTVAQLKEQEKIREIGEVLVSNQPPAAIDPAAKIAEEKAYTASRILEICGDPLPRIPACDYTPGSSGPIPDVDPDSEGFSDYPSKVKEVILTRARNEEKIRGEAILILAAIPVEQLKSKSTNYLRYQVAQKIIEMFPDLKQSFVYKVLNLSYRMKNYYSNYVEYDRYAEIYEDVKQCFYENHCNYGKVRLCQALRDDYGIYLSVPTVKKLMNRLNLVANTNVSRHRYSSAQGVVGKICPNYLQRMFGSSIFGEKLVTDVTEFNLAGVRVYLSAQIDLATHMVIASSVSLSPTVNMVRDNLVAALEVLPKDVKTFVHSDQGHQYQRASYTEVIAQYPNVTQSMSKKGNCLDNAMAEGFFAALKREATEKRHFSSVNQLVTTIDHFIHWYNSKRIQASLGYKSPIQKFYELRDKAKKEAAANCVAQSIA